MKTKMKVNAALAAIGLFSSFGGMQEQAGLPVQVSTVRSVSQASEPAEVKLQSGAAIDLAICLDTSGSMNGLIESAKQKLWSIVNELALAEPIPRLRVALITFGNDGHDPSKGWVKVESGLTDNLDVISLRLFALKTKGGTELVGRALHVATEQLKWDAAPGALKMIVVAGNESAHQDTEVLMADASKRAITRGIVVNSVYCGSARDADATGWAQVAKLAEGYFASIDKDNGTLVVASPYDAELAALSTELNATYLPFGDLGEWNCSNQMAQDTNAVGLNSAAAASRAITKGGKLYNCGWDLVDAMKAEQFKLEQVAIKDLPELMQAMQPAEREAHIESMRTKRGEIQEKIASLGAKRAKFVATETERLRSTGKQSFEFALLKAIRSHAVALGFRFPGQVQVAKKSLPTAAAEVRAPASVLAIRANSKVN